MKKETPLSERLLIRDFCQKKSTKSILFFFQKKNALSKILI